MISLGFIGGLLAGAFGLGGGSIFNPVLLTLGLPPLVAGASALYLVTFSKIVTSTVYFVYGFMPFTWGFWLAFCSAVGSVLASIVSRWILNKTGRQSFLVWVLFFNFVLTIAMMLYSGIDNMKAVVKRGGSITSFTKLC